MEWADVIQRMDDPSNNPQMHMNLYHIFPIPFPHPPILRYTVSLLKDKVIFQIIQAGLALDRCIYCQCIPHDRDLSSTLIPLHSNSGEMLPGFFSSTSGIFMPMASQPDKNNTYILLKYKHSKRDIRSKQMTERD